VKVDGIVVEKVKVVLAHFFRFLLHFFAVGYSI